MKFKTSYESKGEKVIGGVLFEDGVAELSDADGNSVKHVLTQFYGCEQVVEEPAKVVEKPATEGSLKTEATKNK